MKKILGINISHHVSFAYFENDVLKEYYEEDRFNKEKNFVPFHPFLDDPYEYLALKKFKDTVFDKVAIVSYDRGDILIDKAYIDNILKQVKYKELKFYYTYHHIMHAISGYYFSNFNEAICLISDGGGEYLRLNKDKMKNLRVLESIYYINNKIVKKFYQHYSNIFYDYFENYKKASDEIHLKEDGTDYKLSNNLVSGCRYKMYLEKAGFKEGEEGQLMGVAAYKDKNTDIDKHVLDIADKAQKETLEEKIELVKKAQTYSDCKNIILSGGYHLNCANNFKLVKQFPKLNFFVDPIPYDGGTAVGAAYAFYNYEKNFKN